MASRRVVAALGTCALVAGAASFVVTRAPRSRDVRIVVTSELRARVRRCGCQGPKGPTFDRPEKIGICCHQHQYAGTEILPDLGGLPERSAWLSRLEGAGDVLSLDAGDLLFPASAPLPFERGEWERRARLLLEGYDLLGVRAWVPGELDLALGRGTLLSLLSRSSMKTLAANLRDATTHRAIFPASALLESSGTTVGVVGAFSPELSEEGAAALARQGLEVAPPAEAVRAAVSDLRSKGAVLVVLLAHAPEDRVREIVRAVPGIDLAFAAHAAVGADALVPLEDRTAVARALPGGKAPLLATVRIVPGAEGVVVAQASLDDRHWLEQLEKQELERLRAREAATDDAARKEIDAQLSHVRAEIEKTRAKLPRGKRHEAHVTAQPLDAKELREGQDQRLLLAIDAFKRDVESLALDAALVTEMEEPGKTPSGSTTGFLTGTACASCHEKQAKVWQETKHAKAWASLELASNEKDPECVRCHSIGFREPGGFAEVRRAVRKDGTGSLDFRNVQCEACHGPRLGHPRKEGVGVHLPGLEQCRRCHDAERDPGFSQKRLDEAVAASKVCAKNGSP